MVSTQQVPTASLRRPDISSFLKEVMRRRNRLRSQLAHDIGVSHATVSRWLSGSDIPSTRSCRKLAEYSGWPLQEVLALAGHVPSMPQSNELPEFREYAHRKYPKELDDDLIAVIESIIERRRAREHG